jgi:hypothetical protein
MMVALPAACLAEILDVPPSMRQENYSPQGQGSCAWASTITAARCHGLFETADWLRAHFHSGATITDIEDMLAISKTRWAQTDGYGEQSYEECVAFLEWAARNRHVCGIAYKPYHVINFVGIQDGKAVLLDNNRVGTYEYVDLEEFYQTWYHQFGGYAWTFVHNPLPPWPEMQESA